ncbi:MULTISPECIES: ParB/RepB/Spo0J family partition protein [Bradyrhizobium]|jgi:ParB family transcriptional regulator, chromosome partitioning protein|uniref:ParB/RepB/Spo0J family partition protein n=1 Tax=Bradyrhizobium TaxID=374 RepID=UPI000489C207|nr:MULTISPECIES: ParB/RepB/Spo0J family partition protein [Bradyrhizobium]MCS3451512.1 ParB family chromosome partitioning protein [Bradyrhizobium elkanii]MCS3566389.1 ParB family chromosome partitioning protein [Bradyrhizobium elkanii]MCW2152882.1 ParB family chromosome partitioning protein [Bradyrhizobium elkanii]MCW2376614.1 ParB family chromosome partitioning protein [Bradyrhizobium elkanii]MDI2111034.1 ParB/RepB/Spo0J family partition protein [Bradyrhizobium sp. Mp64]
MATAVQKITLSSSRDIPFNKLVLSQSNVRRVKAGVSIEELAEDIARRTLLQSLNVRSVLDAKGAETGMFEIPAGGRRYRALELLVKQKRLAKTAPVPCVVRDSGVAEEDSLAENVQRAPLHPLDQFRAFQALREKGRTEEDIAAAFFTSVNVVKQRLRLASVSPELLDIYAEDGISLEQLMAFTVTADHGRQEQVWQAISGSWQKEPYQIRRMLTEKTVRASDRRAMFVGLDAYEAAGGVVLRDLFQSDDGGWLEDVALLDRLVAEKLKAEAKTIAAEGWKWIEVAIDFPYGHTRGLRELDGVSADVTAEEQATIEALKAEYTRLEAEHDGADELPDEIDQRLGEIETALAAFDDRPISYQLADITRAGVFVGIDAEGTLLVDRGYVRPEDELPVAEPEQGSDGEPAAATLDGAEPLAPGIQRAVITIGGQVAEAEDEDDDAMKPLPDRLLTELTAERTLALRDRLGITPSVAFQSVLYKFCLDVFSRYSSYGTAMEVSVRSASFPVQAQGLNDTPAAKAIDARHKTWEERLPKDKADLWDWLTGLTGEEQAALFAHCASFGVNALYEKGDRYGGGATPHTIEQRITEADRIARAVNLDMVNSGWRPTVENYLGRVPKLRILEAVREGAGERAAQLIDHLKKGDMAKEAERLLAETGWLPEPLRMPDAQLAAAVDGAESKGDGEALPEFLAGDEEETSANEADESRMIAAE